MAESTSPSSSSSSRYNINVGYKTKKLPFQLGPISGRKKGAQLLKITDPKKVAKYGWPVQVGDVLLSINGNVVLSLYHEHIEAMITELRLNQKSAKRELILTLVDYNKAKEDKRRELKEARAKAKEVGDQTAFRGDEVKKKKKKKKRKTTRSGKHIPTSEQERGGASSGASSGEELTAMHDHVGDPPSPTARDLAKLPIPQLASATASAPQNPHVHTGERPKVYECTVHKTWRMLPFRLEPPPDKPTGSIVKQVMIRDKAGHYMEPGNILVAINDVIVLKTPFDETERLIKQLRKEQERTEVPIVFKFADHRAAQRHREEKAEAELQREIEAEQKVLQDAEDEAERAEAAAEELRKKKRREEQKKKKLEDKARAKEEIAAAKAKAELDEKLKVHLIEFSVPAVAELPFTLQEIPYRPTGLCVESIVDASKVDSRLKPFDILLSLGGKKLTKEPDFKAKGMIKNLLQDHKKRDSMIKLQFIDHEEAKFHRQYREEQRRKERLQKQQQREEMQLKRMQAREGRKQGAAKTNKQIEATSTIANMSHDDLLNDMLKGKETKEERLKRLRAQGSKSSSAAVKKHEDKIAEKQQREQRLAEARERKEIAKRYIAKQEEEKRVAREKEKIKIIFDLIDVDKSDSISLGEFVHGVENDDDVHEFVTQSEWLHKLVVEGKLRSAFKDLDRDGGGISFAEFWDFCEHIQTSTRQEMLAKNQLVVVNAAVKKTQPRALVLSERTLSNDMFLITFGAGTLGIGFGQHIDPHTASKYIIVTSLDKRHSSQFLKIGDMLHKVAAITVDEFALQDLNALLEKEHYPIKMLFQHATPDTEAHAQNILFQQKKVEAAAAKKQKDAVEARLETQKQEEEKRQKTILKQKKKISELYRKSNKDGDGSLNRDELASMVKKMQVYVPEEALPDEKECRKLIRMMGDMDNSGTIDEKEFTSWLVDHLDMTPEEREAIRTENAFMAKMEAFLRALGMWLKGEKPPPDKKEQERKEAKERAKKEKKEKKERAKAAKKAEELTKQRAEERAKRKKIEAEEAAYAAKSEAEKNEDTKQLLRGISTQGAEESPIETKQTSSAAPGMNYGGKKAKRPGANESSVLANYDSAAGRTEEYKVIFKTMGLGLVLDEDIVDRDKNHRVVRIMSVSHARAKLNPGTFAIGDCITRVNDTAVDGLGYFEIMKIIQASKRPVAIVFKNVDAEHAFDIDEKSKKINVVLRIQAWFRGRKVRAEIQPMLSRPYTPTPERSQCATVIQTAARQWLARRILPRLRRIRKENMKRLEKEKLDEAEWMADMADALTLAGFTDGESFLWEEVLAELEEIEDNLLSTDDDEGAKETTQGETEDRDDKDQEDKDDYEFAKVVDGQIPVSAVWQAYAENEYLPNAAFPKSFAFTPPDQFAEGIQDRLRFTPTSSNFSATPALSTNSSSIVGAVMSQEQRQRLSFSSSNDSPYIPTATIPNSRRLRGEHEYFAAEAEAYRTVQSPAAPVFWYQPGYIPQHMQESVQQQGPHVRSFGNTHGAVQNHTRPPGMAPRSVSPALQQQQQTRSMQQQEQVQDAHDQTPPSYLSMPSPYYSGHGEHPTPMESKTSNVKRHRHGQRGKVVFMADMYNAKKALPSEPNRADRGKALFNSESFNPKGHLTIMPPKNGGEGAPSGKILFKAEKLNHGLGLQPVSTRISRDRVVPLRPPQGQKRHISPRKVATKAVGMPKEKYEKWESKYYDSILRNGVPAPNLYRPKIFTKEQMKRAKRAKMEYIRRMRKEKEVEELLWRDDGQDDGETEQLLGAHHSTVVGGYYFSPRAELRKEKERQRREKQASKKQKQVALNARLAGLRS
jgi:Ca2+-binding EF-hand superfamily protein